MSTDRRESGRIEDLVFLRVNEMAGLGEIGLPVGMRLQLGALARALLEALITPEMNHLVEGPELGREISKHAADDFHLNGHALGLIDADILGKLAGMESVDALLDDHGVAPSFDSQGWTPEVWEFRDACN